MSNTQLRIISGLILATIVTVSVYVGTQLTLILIGAIAILTVDEIYCNFFKNHRFSVGYFVSFLIFTASYGYIFFISPSKEITNSLNIAALIINLFLILYLFLVDMESDLIHRISDKIPQVGAIIILFPVVSLSSIMFQEKWQALLAVLLLVNFGMDTGAWLFGKNFGKHKLWKKVSPNKTIEGLFGGMFTSSIVGGLSWYGIFGQVRPVYFILFAFLGAMSQVGDLIQSKMKRQVGVKDSSALIPGHGGVYDRIDSLIFLSPFYVLVLRFIL